jgi:hypothetical protein
MSTHPLNRVSCLFVLFALSDILHCLVCRQETPWDATCPPAINAALLDLMRRLLIEERDLNPDTRIDTVAALLAKTVWCGICAKVRPHPPFAIQWRVLKGISVVRLGLNTFSHNYAHRLRPVFFLVLHNLNVHLFLFRNPCVQTPATVFCLDCPERLCTEFCDACSVTEHAAGLVRAIIIEVIIIACSCLDACV